MGGIQKEATIRGRDLQTAFEELQDEDREQLGDDIYSGGWNNATGVKEVSWKRFNQAEEDGTEKYEDALAVCVRKPIGNNNKIKTSVINFPVKGTRKWETRYQAESSAEGWSSTIVSELKQADAIKKVRAYVAKHPDEKIVLEIVKVLVGANPKVAEISYKKASNEADGEWNIIGTLSY